MSLMLLGYSRARLIWRLSHPLETVSFWTGLDFDPQHWDGDDESSKLE